MRPLPEELVAIAAFVEQNVTRLKLKLRRLLRGDSNRSYCLEIQEAPLNVRHSQIRDLDERRSGLPLRVFGHPANHFGDGPQLRPRP